MIEHDAEFRIARSAERIGVFAGDRHHVRYTDRERFVVADQIARSVARNQEVERLRTRRLVEPDGRLRAVRIGVARIEVGVVEENVARRRTAVELQHGLERHAVRRAVVVINLIPFDH